MSFSSTSTSESSSSSESGAPPNYKKLERLLLALINLARKTYSSPSHSRMWSSATEYLRIHTRLNAFFAKHQQCDFVADGTYGYCLEMQILLRLIETGLGTVHRDIEGLIEVNETKMDDQIRKTLTRRVNTDVEWLVFRGAELDCERLPWNLKERAGDDSSDAGVSS